VFNFIAAVAGTTLAFLFPGLFYLVGKHRYEAKRMNLIDGHNNDNEFWANSNQQKFHVFLAWFHVVLSVFIFCFFMTTSILAIVL